jgi:hypothetical protein
VEGITNYYKTTYPAIYNEARTGGTVRRQRGQDLPAKYFPGDA